MQINSTDKIAGVSILDVRKLLRNVDNESEWGTVFVVGLLKITPAKANDLLQELYKENYIELGHIDKDQQYWRKTFKGSTLGLSSAARSINRKTADRVFSDFMARVHEVKNNPNYLLKVKKVIVFGSYLTNKPKINDIDIAVELAWKEEHKNIVEVSLNHAEKAREKGRRFSTYLEELGWPEQEIYLFLKSRSRTISLHTHDDILKEAKPQKVMWDD